MKNTLQIYEHCQISANNHLKKYWNETLFKCFAIPFKISLQKKRFHFLFLLYKQ